MDYSQFFRENYDVLLTIMNGFDIGIWITDGEGNVIMVNDRSLKGGKVSREELMGRNMVELVETGYVIHESSVLKAIDSGKRESIIQELGEGGYCLATSTPLFYKGKTNIVLCVERNISEVAKTRDLLTQQQILTEKFSVQLAGQKQENGMEREEMVAHDISTIRLREKAIQIGKIDATVIIIGESGTGKEIVADLIYHNSDRKGSPFIKVNCAAIPDTLIESEFFGYEAGAFTGASQNGKAGLFEMAQGGILFLDEIGELPLLMQSKLLRILQDKAVRRIGGEKEISVDVRIIAATNRNLKEEMENGSFRSDLYYRLFVVPIEIPPLRKRREDIAPLAHSFLRQFNELYGMKKRLNADAISALESYSWPGNVRELRNVIERLAISGAGSDISKFQVQMCLGNKEDLSVDMILSDGEETGLEELVDAYEKHIITRCIEKYGNATEAAKKLQVNKSTISRKMKKYRL